MAVSSFTKRFSNGETDGASKSSTNKTNKTNTPKASSFTERFAAGEVGNDPLYEAAREIVQEPAPRYSSAGVAANRVRPVAPVIVPRQTVEPVQPNTHSHYSGSTLLPSTRPAVYTDENLPSYLDRARALSELSSWNDEQRAEAEEIYEVMRPKGLLNGGSIGQMVNDARYGLTRDASVNPSFNARIQEGGDLYDAWNDVYTRLGYRTQPGVTGFTANLMQGAGATPLSEAVYAGLDRLGVDTEEARRGTDLLREVAAYGRQEAPVASTAGSVAGSVALYSNISNVVSRALGAAGGAIARAARPAGRALQAGSVAAEAGTAIGGSPVANTLIRAAASGLTHVATDAIRRSGDVATGRITGKQYAQSMAKSGVAGVATGLASALVSAGASSIINKYNLRTPLAYFARSMATGVTGAGTYAGLGYALADKTPNAAWVAAYTQRNPGATAADAQEAYRSELRRQAGEQFFIGFITTLIQSGISTAQIAAQSKQAMLQHVSDLYGEAGAKTLERYENAPIEERQQIAQDILFRINNARENIASGLYDQNGNIRADLDRAVVDTALDVDAYLAALHDFIAFGSGIEGSVTFGGATPAGAGAGAAYTPDASVDVTGLAAVLGDAIAPAYGETGVDLSAPFVGDLAGAAAAGVPSQLPANMGAEAPDDLMALAQDVQTAQNATETRLASPVEERVPAETYNETPADIAAENAPETAIYAEDEGMEIDSALASAGESLRESAVNAGIGESGQQAIAEFYEPQDSVPEYFGGFSAFYNAGRNSTPIEEVPARFAEAMSPVAAQAAYNSGRMDALAAGEGVATLQEPVYNGFENRAEMPVSTIEEGTDYGIEGRDQRTGEGSLRTFAERTGEPVGGMDQGAAADRAGAPAVASAGGNEESAPVLRFTPRQGRDRGLGGVTFGRTVSAADFNFPRADASKTVRIVSGGSSPSMSAARTVAGDSRVVFYGGGYLAVEGNSNIESWSQPSKNLMGIAVDDPNFTADQFAGHEKSEILIGTGKLDYNRVISTARDSVNGLDEALFHYSLLYPGMTEDQLLKEMVCDAAGKMNRVAQFIGKDPEIDEIAEQLGEVIAQLHDIVNAEAGGVFDAVEGPSTGIPIEALQSPQATAEGMLDALADGDIETATEFSYAGFAQAIGFEGKEDEGSGIRWYEKDGKKVDHVTIDDVKLSPVGALIKYSAEMGYLGGTTKEERDAIANSQYQLFTDIGNLAVKNNDFAMSMIFAGAEYFTAIKANSDALYKWTNDFKSVCVKTQSVIDSMSEAMLAKKGGLKKDEILDIYRKVSTNGLPVSCPECYVFERWVGIGGLLDNIWKYQNRYGKMTPEQVISAYKTMETRVQALADEAGLTFGKAKTKLSDKVTKEYNKLREKIGKARNNGEAVSKENLAKLAVLEKSMTDVKALTWIEKVYFGGKAMTPNNVNPKYAVPYDILFDLNKGGQFATQFKDAWNFRTTQGAGYGKAITPYAQETVGETILGVSNLSNVIKKKAAGTLKNPFLDSKGELTKEAKDQLAKAAKKEKAQLFRGGHRLNSTSDAGNDVATDYVLVMLELQAMHAGAQIYTKVDGAVGPLARMGAFMNQSLMPLGSGLDENGELADTSKGGMNPETAFKNREMYPTAGTITIGVNDAHIRKLYQDYRRDFIIPYHASGGDQDLVAEFRAVQDPDNAKKAKVRSTDYTRTQSEKLMSDALLKNIGKTEDEIARIHANREARIAILTGGNPNMNVVMSNPLLQDLYRMFNGGRWTGVTLSKGEIEHTIFPYEIWDESADYDHSGINVVRYLDYCDALGLLHKFSGTTPRSINLPGGATTTELRPVKGYDEHGKPVMLTDLAYKYVNGVKTGKIEDFYWKTLIDRRMYDNDGKYITPKTICLNGIKKEDVQNFAKYNWGLQYDAKRSAELAKRIGELFLDKYKNEEDTAEPVDTAFSTAVTDEGMLKRLNAAEAEGIRSFDSIQPGDKNGVVKVYRAMQAQPVDENGQVIPNSTVLRIVSYDPLTVEARVVTGKGKGKRTEVITAPAQLYSPMAGSNDGVWRAPIELGVWEMSEGHPERAFYKIDEKTGKPKIDTIKENASYGEIAYYYGLEKSERDKNKPMPARYNPYTHTSLSALNDQFSSANKRPELVTVETLVPIWHISNGKDNERLIRAKDRVGPMSWHSGPTSSRLAQINKARVVILTRYDKPIRVVPDAEVARSIAENIGDSKNIAIPESTVTPSLAAELKALGVSVLNAKEWEEYNAKFPTETFARDSGNLTKEPKRTSRKTSKATTTEYSQHADSEYLDAVKRGDMETAQRMVDEAAKAAGYTRRAFHQTSAKNITVFDLSIGTNGGTDSETPYGVFTKRTNADIGLGDVQMSLYVRPGKTLRFKNREELHRYFGGEYKAILDEIDAINNRYDKLYDAAAEAAAELQDKWLDAHPEIDTLAMPVEEFLKGDFYTGKDVRAAMDKADSIMSRWTDSVNELSIKAKEALTEMLKAEGYDSVEILVDAGSGGRKTDTFISLDNRAVKSADPVTYDDAGNVIPLSERFNPANNDIRYSSASDAAPDAMANLIKENERLRSQVEYWRNQTRLTKDKRAIDPAAVQNAAKELANQYDTMLDKDDAKNLSADLLDLYNTMSHGDGGNIPWATVNQKAQAIADTLVEHAVTVDDELYREYKDLRDYVRTAKFVLTPEQAKDIPDFNDWRKSQFGRMPSISIGKHSNVDQIYMEFADQWPEFFNGGRETGTGDMLLRIAEVLDSVGKIKEVNPHSYAMAEAKASAAQDIIDRFFDLPNVKPTFADRAAEKLRTEKAKAVKAAIERERATRSRQLQALKDHYKEVRQRDRDRRAESALRTRVFNRIKRLNRAKVDPVTKAWIDQLIGDYDTLSKGITGKTIQNLQELQHFYASKFDKNSENYDPDFIRDERTEAAINRLYDKHVSDLTHEELVELGEALLNIENEIRTAKKTIDTDDRRDIYMQGAESIRDIQASPGSRGSLLDKLIVTETLSPIREARRLVDYRETSPFLQRMRDLQDGQIKALDFQMRAERPFQKLVNDKAFQKSFTGKDADAITITGMTADGPKAVQITPAMRVSLYLHSLNDQNLRHIRDGGVKIPDMKLYREGKYEEAYTKGTVVKLTPSQVRSITEGMTPKERAFARLAHAYFNGMSQEEINDVSVRLKGYALAQVSNYFPINTDPAFTRSEFESVKNDGTIEGMGFLKERVNAANPILLRDANDVVNQSIRMTSKYVGLAIPVRNFQKVWNATTTRFNEEGERYAYADSVKSAVGAKWGQHALRYVDKLMSDLQNPATHMTVWRQALSRIRSNYAAAVLTLNPSVAMKQAASYPTAAAVLGWKPIIKALGAGKVNEDLISDFTPLLQYRSRGYSTKELGDMRSADRQLPDLLNWVQGMDLAAVRPLWKASEYYVREHRPELKVGSDEYYTVVADIYNRVITETQPNYTTMERPQLLRSDDSLMANLAMFKTQPFQNFNILFDAVGEYLAKRRYGTDKEKAEARQNLGRAVSSQIAQLAVFAGMTMAWSMFRGKKDKYKGKDGKVTPASFLQGIAKDMIGGAFSTVLFGSEAWEFVSSKLFDEPYYGLDVVTVQALTDTINAMGGMGELIYDNVKALASGEDVNWNSTRIKMDGYLDKVSKAFGVPYENVTNIFNALARWTLIATEGEYMGEYGALKLTVDPDTKKAPYYELLYSAYNSNRSEFRKLYNQMLKDGFEADKIKSGVENLMKKAEGVSSVKDLKTRFNP